MKQVTLIIISILIFLSIYCQDITGNWNRILKVQGMQLRLVSLDFAKDLQSNM